MPVSVVGDPGPAQVRSSPLTQLLSAAGTPLPQRLLKFLRNPFVFISCLTLVALFIQGYHPYADDAAIYVAGIEKVIHPSLFSLHAEYVLPHLKHSAFSFALGWLIRGLHIPLGYALFASYLASLWLMLFACWRLASLLFSGSPARLGAILLMTATLTLPVAGTAIFIFDPYLTARSFSTPLTLFAIAYVLERRMVACALCLIAAFILHPLMAALAIGYVVTLALFRGACWKWLTAACICVLSIGFAASHAGMLLGTSAAYHVATMSRSYFFLSRWEWYEIFGLFPPLVACCMYLARRNSLVHSNYAVVSAASLYTGVLAIVFALCYTLTDNSYLLARLQVLRVFQVIYILFFLLLGSLLGQYVLRRRWWAWTGCFGAIAALMFTVQICVYPALAHVEWPWSRSQNPWAQAFLWIRGNTPNDAYFALDPHYQSLPQEDTLGFRAMTQRSALPDWNKDGGIAAIDPAIASEWWKAVTTTTGFSYWTDRQRIQTLTPYGVDWIVLSAGTATQLSCPYTNSAVRICHLPADVASLASATHPATVSRP